MFEAQLGSGQALRVVRYPEMSQELRRVATISENCISAACAPPCLSHLGTGDGG